jgi:DNA polymerase III epsilon subunit-like protein
MSIVPGLCIDLETTITSKISDKIRPKGTKRFETRIIEIGAVNWKSPQEKWGCIVNPIPKTVKLASASELFDYLRQIHQRPIRTINFWSKVLVSRRSLTAEMFGNPESPEVWLERNIKTRASDFVRWHMTGSGPKFVSEETALLELIKFTKNRAWLAHNGNSFDFKVLEGCSLRCGLPIPPNIKKYDTLRIFRKIIPGQESYSQPKLYKALLKRNYNAHVAIDDAKALAELCVYLQNSSPGPVSDKSQDKIHLKKHVPRMNLTFVKPHTKSPSPHIKSPHNSLSVVRRLRGVGPKTVAALALVNIKTIGQFKTMYKNNGIAWLKDVLPYGVSWRTISEQLK